MLVFKMTSLTQHLYWNLYLVIFLTFFTSKFFILAANNTSAFESYTDREKNAVKELRALVEPELYNDFTRRDAFLLRWIRDQNFELEKVKTKLVNSLKWRKAKQIDSIEFVNWKKHCPYSVASRDKVGRPVVLLDMRKCSIREIVLKGTAEDKELFGIYLMELAARVMKHEAKTVADVIFVVDMFGFNLREHGCVQCIPIIVHGVTSYEANYPEQIYKAYLLNVPRTFQVVLNVMRPVMSEHFKESLISYGYDQTEWQPVLLKAIDANQLPAQFGGRKKGKL